MQLRYFYLSFMRERAEVSLVSLVKSEMRIGEFMDTAGGGGGGGLIRVGGRKKPLVGSWSSIISIAFAISTRIR